MMLSLGVKKPGRKARKQGFPKSAAARDVALTVWRRCAAVSSCVWGDCMQVGGAAVRVVAAPVQGLSLEVEMFSSLSPICSLKLGRLGYLTV
jgi:hypothetical protein